jgi:AcrR family transcriptional regulator
MSPENHPAPRARRADAERNRAAILVAANRVFAELGPEAALDVIAKTADVANATLYRHFPTRADLLVAVYADEVTELGALGTELEDDPDPGHAFTVWIRAFVHHVASKRALASAIPDDPEGQRTSRFADWHTTMLTAAQHLLERAQDAHAIRKELTVRDLLALASAIALTGRSQKELDALVDLVRDGYRSGDSRQGD